MSDDLKDDDYLWDGTGKPDAEVARLESLLARYRHRGTMPALPGSCGPSPAAADRAAALTAAASLALVAAAAWFGFIVPHVGVDRAVARGDAARSGRHRWIVAAVRRRGDADHRRAIARAAGGRRYRPRGRRAQQPGAVAGVADRGASDGADRGRIRALIWAPPRNFFVDTPSAVAVDLGCAYTLDVDPRGWGLVHVTSGWVAFEFGGRESFIPQNAVCATRPRFGPGTPHYADASAALVEALSILDFPATENVNRASALDVVLGASRRRDALTLWHLLSRGSPDERGRVYHRLNALVAAPAGVTRDRILAGDTRALDAWWNELGLDSASWWRLWKSPWRDR